MKKALFLTGLLLVVLLAQSQKNYKVVFDLTSSDTVDHKAVIRWMNGITKDDPDARVDVVLYGKSLGMVTKDKSVVADQIKELSAKKNVAIKVCAVAMKNNELKKEDLLPGVQIVPDGIYEIIRLQKNGWGYIKAAR